MGELVEEELRRRIAEACAALEGAAPNDPEAAETWADVAEWYARLYDSGAGVKELDEAIAAAERAVSAGADHQLGPIWFASLAQLHWARYGAYSQMDVPQELLQGQLDHALALLEQALDHLVAGHPFTRGVEARLGLAYGSRFTERQDPEDLERGVAILEAALDGWPDAEPVEQRGFFRGRLGYFYSLRFDLTQDWEGDFTRGKAAIVRALAESEDSGESGDPWVERSRVHLAHMLIWQVQRGKSEGGGGTEGLSGVPGAEWNPPTEFLEAMDLLDGLPADSALLRELPPLSLGAYAAQCRERFGARGHRADLLRAEALLTHVVEVWPPGENRWMPWMELAMTRWAMYQDSVDEGELTSLERAFAEAVDDPQVPDFVKRYAKMGRGHARLRRVELGHTGKEEAEPVKGDAWEAVRGVMDGFNTGEVPTNVGVGALPSWWHRAGAADTIRAQMVEGMGRLRESDPGSEERRSGLGVLGMFAPMMEDMGGDAVDAAELDGLFVEAEEAGRDDPAARADLMVHRAKHKLVRALRASDLDEVVAARRLLEEALALVDNVGAKGARRGEIEVLRSQAIVGEAELRGNRDGYDQAARLLREQRETDSALTPFQRLLVEANEALARFSQAAHRRDIAGIDEPIALVQRVVDQLDPDDMARAELTNKLVIMRAARAALWDGREPAAGSPPAPEDRLEPEELRRQFRPLARSTRITALGHAAQAIMAEMATSPESTRFDDAIDLLEEALEIGGPGYGDRSRLAALMGSAYFGKWAAGDYSPAHLDSSVQWYEESLRGADDPGSMAWAVGGMGLAVGYRARATYVSRSAHDRVRSRAAGLRAMRGHAWSVLLQSGTDHATDAASHAASQGLEIAQWCVGDGRPTEAVQALEAGRGLLLHAATVAASVPDLLTSVGRADLAAEWRAAGGVTGGAGDAVMGDVMNGAAGGAAGPSLPSSEPTSAVPGELRHRVLRALSRPGGGRRDREQPVERGAVEGGGPGGAASGGGGSDGGAVVAERLLEPPSPAEIAAALHAQGADALAYLVPGDPATVAVAGCHGSAVVVHADGRTTSVRLPHLMKGAEPPLRFLRTGIRSLGRDIGRDRDLEASPGPGPNPGPTDQALANPGPANPGPANPGFGQGPVRGLDPERDLGPLHGGAPHAAMDAASAAEANRPEEGRRALEALCDWAWEVAMGPLLDHLRAEGAARPPKIVLVPMDNLAAVPWHAARKRRGDGSGDDSGGAGGRVGGGGRRRYRYAVEEAIITYAASARLLCEVMARGAVTYDGDSLVVGDPTHDLVHAGREAAAIHDAFYPTARFLGHRSDGVTDGTGTPEEIRAWLGARADRPGGVLHLACHALVDHDHTRSSFLQLSGGRIAAEELTEGAQRRGGPSWLGLVSLAACTTHVSSRGYDEAFSLATAFLADGARSVFGSLWPVPDHATSYLMFMVHHYLRAEGMQPAVALRMAQLWMLDRERRAPHTMSRELAARIRTVDPDDLTGWAGFTHLGR